MAKKYEPKLGEQIPIVQSQHERVIDYIMIVVGLLIIVTYFVMVFSHIEVDAKREIGISAILALGVSAISTGFAGAMSVEFQNASITARGTLAFGLFILVFGATLMINCNCK